MTESTRRIVLTGDMTYAAALAAFAAAWPNIRLFWYRPTVEHYKEGRPTGEELELAPNDRLTRASGYQAVLRGDMTVQDLHAAMVGSFDLETRIRGEGNGPVWMATLDEANAGVKRSAREWIAGRSFRSGGA
ncbi:hypothetical protein [Zavarzinella formosa]|uniref:hypothetical protein n=1 Tax=Zavarzinella formosa TaxID=360055 RepID=UPI0002FA0357|nr:hypothetical protein [Zavarzinella formosa]